jgi:TolB protein
MIRTNLVIGIVVCFLLGSFGFHSVADETQNALPQYQIGYNEFRTNLPGGRHANWATMRSYVINADGSGRRELAHELVRDENTWTQFTGWSPDGRTAIISNGSNTPENAAWEEANQTFRMTEGWLYDNYLLDMATGQTTNVSAPERMSNYNGGLSYWPGNPNKLLGGALINGINHPVSMDLDGRNKQDLTDGSSGFTYGVQVSPDGQRITYHSDYQVYIANADGSNPQQIDTGNSFNFMPKWSPDGQWLEFLSGDHYDCDPYLVRSDGTGLRKLADRNRYRGEVPIIDVPDFHGGSSDWPMWSPVDNIVYYTSLIGQSVELMQVTLGGVTTQLTHSTTPGTLNYLPTPSPDGKWILFGSNSGGTRQLYIMPAEGGEAQAITDVPAGSGAMFGIWNPVPLPEPSSCMLMMTGGFGGASLWYRRCCHAWKQWDQSSPKQ